MAAVGSPCAGSETYRIGLLRDSLPGHQPTFADELAERIRARGLRVAKIDGELLTRAAALEGRGFDLLVLPSSASLPAESAGTVTAFVAAGGDLVSLGAPAFADPLWKFGDDWLSQTEWRRRIESQPTGRELFTFESDDAVNWQRFTNTPESPASAKAVKGPRGKALGVRIENLQGWDTLASPLLENPFPPGHTLTCLWAKGSEETRAVSLEWRENDGSRWIAVFPVATGWRRVVLSPGDFKYWESVPRRGGRGDRFRPENARRLVVGVAWTHTGRRGGHHEYAIDEIGTAANPLGELPSTLHSPPVLDGLSPAYKFYELREVARLRPRAPWLPPGPDLPLADLRAHHPRPTGKGFNKGRGWRWIPLVEALGPGNEWRGAPASLCVDFSGPRRGSARAAFSGGDRRWYGEPSVQEAILETVERMALGIYLEEAGAEFFTYRPGESVLLGARVANLSRAPSPALALRFELRPRGLFQNSLRRPEAERDGTRQGARTTRHSGEYRRVRVGAASGPRSRPKPGWGFETAPDGETRPLLVIEESLEIPAGGSRTVQRQTRLPEEAEAFDLRVELRASSRVIDRVSHDIAVFRPKPEAARRYVTARDGDFHLDGRKWYVHGVNYMPSTGIGIEDRSYFEYWLGARSYDPEFVQRDLERSRDLGFNAISIFVYHRSLGANNLIDIIRRSRDLDLKVNLSIRPGTPMDYRWDRWRQIISRNRLREIDTIYAYDIAWEPFFGSEGERRRYDSLWREWLQRKHGSVEAAEASWGVPAPRHDGRASTPVAAQLAEDGPHRRMVADYRNFADELIHSRYRDAAEKIRALDPHHLVSFRMTVTGDPTFDGSRRLPYDFMGVARCMDFLAPEGYGRIGDWERIRPGIFTVAYARHCAPGKPVLWAEAGVSAWDRNAARADPGLLDFQARFYADFYRMVLESYSSGVVWWWYPGGFRVNEKSDYGIINPDGTDRPVSRVIRRHAARVLSPRAIPEPDVWIEIDRDADARGLFGVYLRVQESFWQAVEAGKYPGLRRSPSPARRRGAHPH